MPAAGAGQADVSCHNGRTRSAEARSSPPSISTVESGISTIGHSQKTRIGPAPGSGQSQNSGRMVTRPPPADPPPPPCATKTGPGGSSSGFMKRRRWILPSRFESAHHPAAPVRSGGSPAAARRPCSKGCCSWKTPLDCALLNPRVSARTLNTIPVEWTVACRRATTPSPRGRSRSRAGRPHRARPPDSRTTAALADGRQQHRRRRRPPQARKAA